MAMPTFCPRCLWYRLHCGNAPFAMFPSIFTEIDLATKKVVHANIDKRGHAPKWMGSFSAATGYKNVGFLNWTDEDNSITLRGGPDAVLTGDKGELYLADYKTARYTAGQDRLLPLYRIQLLGYAFLLEENGHKRPDHAALIYFGPPSDPTQTESLAMTRNDGFALPLAVEMVDIKLGDYKPIHTYLEQTRRIYDEAKAPDGVEGCRDCKSIDNYVRQASFDSRPQRGTRTTDVYCAGQFRRLQDRIENDPEILAHDSGDWYPDWVE